MDNIVIIKLLNDTDIISRVLEQDDYDMMLDNPLQIVSAPTEENYMKFYIMPWLPYGLLDSNILTINKNSILTTLEPNEMAKKFYIKTLEDLSIDMLGPGVSSSYIN